MKNTSVEELTVLHNATTLYNHLATAALNASLHDGCVKVVFSEMEFLPWDNPDNIVKEEVENISRRMKNNMLVFLFLIGGPGNVINMAVFYKQGLKDHVNLCLFALSLADELYLMTSMFLHAEQLHLQFTTKETFGPMMTFLTNSQFTGLVGFGYVSQILSAVIASERCYCVLSPLKFQAMKRTRTMALVIIVVNVLMVGLFFIVAFRYRIGCVYDPVSGVIVKTGVSGDFYNTHQRFVDLLNTSVFGFGLPGCVITVVTVTTIATTVKLRQIVTWRAGTSSSLSAREVALTRMLVATSILFIACVLPTAAARVAWFVFPEMNAGRRKQNFYLTSLWLSESFTFVNSSFNIFVYYVMGSRYRETFKALFTRQNRS